MTLTRNDGRSCTEGPREKTRRGASEASLAIVEGMEKTCYCPLKSNRQVEDSGAERPHRRVDELDWSEQELESGKLIKIEGFPKKQR